MMVMKMTMIAAEAHLDTRTRAHLKVDVNEIKVIFLIQLVLVR